MSLRIDTADLYPGSCVIGVTGLGVPGADIPSTGTHGASVLWNDISLPADAAKEIRARIITPPAAGSFFMWEDGSASLTGAPDGVYPMTYGLVVDGVDLGTAISTITIGSESLSALSGSAQIADLTADGGLGGVLVLGSLVGSRRKTMSTRTNRQTATR